MFNDHRKDKGEPTCTFCCQKKNQHTCGHGLVGRDASHGDSVSRSLVRKAGSEGGLQEIQWTQWSLIKEVQYANMSGAVSSTSLYGKSGKEIISHRGIFKIQLSPSWKWFMNFFHFSMKELLTEKRWCKILNAVLTLDRHLMKFYSSFKIQLMYHFLSQDY